LFSCFSGKVDLRQILGLSVHLPGQSAHAASIQPQKKLLQVYSHKYIILFSHIAIWQLCHSDSHPLLFRLAGKLPRNAIASEIKCSGKTRGDLAGKPKPWSGDK